MVFGKRCALAVLAVFFYNCAAQALPEGARPLVIHATAKSLTLSVEIADDEQERAHGLMFRKTLSEDGGMLFVFPRQEPRSFWMKNTPLPLDILFLAADGEIVAIVRDTTPFSTASINSIEPAKYALEVNAGYCARHGVNVGDRVGI